MGDFSVENKVVIVTGGSGVLGGSMARHFARHGSKLVLIGRNKEKIDEAVSAVEELGANALGIACDVLDSDGLKSAKKLIIDTFGQIDVLINAAGGNVAGATQSNGQEVFDLNHEALNQAIDINLKGAIYPSLIFGEAIAKNGAGSIINISSMATYTAITRVMGYSVAKTGVNSFTQWMASEMAQRFGDKVRVNAIAPGFFIGDQNRKLLLNEDGSLTERSEKVIAKTPMGRFGEIDELNGAAQFLCSEQASFITGVVLPVDGGFSAFSGV
ncbi:SDR family oxidoreductase [Reichenbachiella ulvae]|uniref:SDR family oxidoreductase n=1 Tax=Reichenbachiella ulvae TaxID=2980104 RepID=A0ABT3CSC4_9BACT|nr:SDR family oxidoreductase [Reichenbachiella ulvae]MCV9386601.1 SDR family oxidoreductase [Reichenbachiella ulvae]